MRLLFCSYRDWANDVLHALRKELPHVLFDHAQTPSDLTSSVNRATYDFVAVVGWSWKIEAAVTDTNVVIGMHPSKLPDYAGGSPIQHQIIDGLKQTHATLFRLTSKLDGGDIVASCAYPLEGHLDQVLSAVAGATFKLLKDLITQWPSIEYKPQQVTSVRRRLKPEQSQLAKDELLTTTCAKLYDLIRCREDPYPNAFIEDETGRLTFKVVEFEPKR